MIGFLFALVACVLSGCLGLLIGCFCSAAKTTDLVIEIYELKHSNELIKSRNKGLEDSLARLKTDSEDA